MNKLTRWTIFVNYDDEVEDVNGKWVLFDDVAELQKKVEELTLACKVEQQYYAEHISAERKAIESEIEAIVHKFRHVGYVPTNDIEHLADRILTGEFASKSTSCEKQ